VAGPRGTPSASCHNALHCGESLKKNNDPLTVEAIKLSIPFFISHKIPKRNSNRQGGYRIVWEVINGPLADAYKAFARRFDLFARQLGKGYLPDTSISIN
jgi:hypothetical protein